MKHLLLLTTLFFLSHNLFAQQELRCSSYEYQQQMMKENPEYAQLMQQSEIYFENYVRTHKLQKGTRSVITIPVVVHFLWNPDSTQYYLSDWQISSQIDVLNEDYRRFNADKFSTPSLFDSVAADCEIEFCLAKRDTLGNFTTGIERRNTSIGVMDITAIKHTSSGGLDGWDHNNYLNIWVGRLSTGTLGITTFPSINMNNEDGVVCTTKAFGRLSTVSKKYNLGRTATHEVGHWLNVKHIWGDLSGCSTDDGCDDTPKQDDYHFACETFPFPSCNNTSDMYMNYMDYTPDSCMNIFTFDQRERMQDAITAFRSSLLISQGCNSPVTFNNDIGVSKILFPDELIYADSIIPVVRVMNYGSQTISSAEIVYEKNWKNEQHTYNWSGSLTPGSYEDVTLPAIKDSLWYNIFCAWTKNPNGTVDEDTTNDFRTRSYIGEPSKEITPETVLVYPNPSGTIFTIEFSNLESVNGTLRVFNVLGQSEYVPVDAISTSKFQIDLSNFASAMYFLELTVGGKVVVKKIIVQHEL